MYNSYQLQMTSIGIDIGEKFHLITERSEVYMRRDRVFVRLLCELLKLRSCLLQ
jgi:hypothetical protein